MKKKNRLFALVAVAAVLLSGCAQSSAGNGEEGADGPPKIRLGYQVNGGQTPQYVAETEGFFKKNGLEVERVRFNDSTTLVSAIQRGDIDVISSIPGSVLAAREQGFELVSFIQNEAAKYEAPDSGTVMVPAGSEIKSIADLTGKKIGTSGGRGSQLTADVFSVLEDNGVEPESVTLVDAPFTTHPDLLASGQIDAVITIDPFTTRILSQKTGSVLFYPYLDSNPGQPLSAWWASKRWIDENPDLVEKFQSSIRESIDWLRADDARARDAVASFTNLDRDLLEQMPVLRWAYEIDKEAWDRNVDILVEQGVLTKEQTTDDYWAPSMSEFVKTT
jgi:NitT/TauT family transport system substrate-binding protein